MIRIVIADDHDVVRKGLALILEATGEMKVVNSFSNGTDALNWFYKNDCDVALIDISMPGMNGIDLLMHLRNEKPKLPVLILSAHPEDQYAVRLIKNGAAGYLNKDCLSDEVLRAVRCVLGGKRHISPAVAELLANEVSFPDGKHPHETLSMREYQIFMLLASAKTPTEIASLLKLSVRTVSTYRNRLLEKMNMRTNAELMRYAVDHHLVE